VPKPAEAVFPPAIDHAGEMKYKSTTFDNGKKIQQFLNLQFRNCLFTNVKLGILILFGYFTAFFKNHAYFGCLKV